jgi:hypothetical protein
MLRWGTAIAVVAALSMCARTPAKTPASAQMASPLESSVHCEKDFYVFVDISGTMSTKDTQSGKVPLVEFSTAARRVLDGLVGDSDHVVLYAFSQDVYTLASTNPDVPAESHDYKTALDALADKNEAQLRKTAQSIVKNEKDLQYTDFRRVFDKLLEVSGGHTQKYFIVASDFYHDTDNWLCKPDAKALVRISDDLQYMRHKVEKIKERVGGFTAHLVPLAQTSPCPNSTIATQVVKIFDGPFSLPMNKTVDAFDSPADDIRAAFADAPEPTVTGGVGKADTIPFSVRNRNPFQITLRKAELIDDQKLPQVLDTISPDKPIACGEKYTFELSTKNCKASKSILARATYDVGEKVSQNPILIDSVDFTAWQATYIPAVIGNGTLILDVTFTDGLREPRNLTVTIGHKTERFTLMPNGGVAQRVALPFEVIDEDRKDATAASIPVSLSLDNARFSRNGVEPKDGKTPAEQTPWSLPRIFGKLIEVMSDIGGAVGFITVLLPLGWRSGLKRGLIALVSLMVIATNFLPLDVHSSLNAIQIAIFWASIGGLSGALAAWGLVLFIWGRFWEPQLVTAGLASGLRRRAWRWIIYSAIAGATTALIAHPFPFDLVVNHPL